MCQTPSLFHVLLGKEGPKCELTVHSDGAELESGTYHLGLYLQFSSITCIRK